MNTRLCRFLGSDAFSTTEKLTLEAKSRLDGYEWMAAAELYKRILELNAARGDQKEQARTTVLIGNCFFKAAFQAADHQEFERRMRLAKERYEAAAAQFREAALEGPSKLMASRSLFVDFWLSGDAPEKERKLGKCISLAKEGMGVLERDGDKVGIAQARKNILLYLSESVPLTKRYNDFRQQLQSIIDIGESVAKDWDQTQDSEDALESLWRSVVCSAMYFDYCFSRSEIEEVATKIKSLAKRLAEVSNLVKTELSLAAVSDASAFLVINFEGDYSKATALFQDGLSHARMLNDSLLVAQFAWNAAWTGITSVFHIDDVEASRTISEGSRKLCEEAIRSLDISGHPRLLQSAYATLSSYYVQTARFVETEASVKRAALNSAIELARQSKSLGDFGFSGSVSYPTYFLSLLMENSEEKTSLLKQALAMAEEEAKITDLHDNPDSTNRATSRLTLSRLKSELSRTSAEVSVKISLLRSAASDAKLDVQNVEGWTKTVSAGYATFYSYHAENYGDILAQLYSLIADSTVGRDAVAAYEKAVNELVRQSNLVPIPLVRWKIAKVLDNLGDYESASQAFGNAGKDCDSAVEKIPATRHFFDDLRAYMEAWQMIEKSRINHLEEKFTAASASFSAAAEKLRSTDAYNHLSQHYEACADLEDGETLSRQENHQEAIQSFGRAEDKFHEHARLLKNKLSAHPSQQQGRAELENWVEVSLSREQFCKARAAIEEARSCEQSGDEDVAIARYRLAQKTIKDLLAKPVQDQTSNELTVLAIFCEAWTHMLQAEMKLSPDEFSEAAVLFARVENQAIGRRWRQVASANQSICQALHQGAMFRRTRDPNVYSEIKKNLETAADFYEQAGLERAIAWTRGTQKLFDSLIYLAEAETERDPDKKTKLFHLAEKHLDRAVGLYDKAGFARKKEEALKLLSRARDEKRLLLSPLEALSRSPAAYEAPILLTRDQALGIEALQGTSITGSFTLSARELGVGSNVTMNLDMVNVGKTPATLVKLEGVVPEGLDIEEGNGYLRRVGACVELKGKRLEYMSSHGVRIVLRARHKGTFEVKPKVLFVDEKGVLGSFEFQPTDLVVKELGISGWLKGPRSATYS